MNKRIALGMALLAVTILLAGCGTPSATGDSGNQEAETSAAAGVSAADTGVVSSAVVIEPEQLINREEAEQLLGEPVKEGEKSQMESIGQRTVYYESESFGFLQVSLVQPGTMPPGSITPADTYDGAKAGLEGTVDFTISGIGDDCFAGTPGLHILSSDCYIVIAAGNTGDADIQNVLQQAGELLPLLYDLPEAPY